MAPVNRSPSSIATRSSNAAAAASSSNAAGKRVARSPPPTSDDEIDTVRAPREEPRQRAPVVNLPEDDAPAPPDFSYALDPRNKDQILKHTHHLFPEAKKLVPSGSNFRTWLMKMEELADFALDYRNFYFEDFSRHLVDHIACVIFRIALSNEIKEDINHRDSCYAIMISIWHRFTTFSRAAQINRWAALKSISCDQQTPATTIAATYRRRLLDLKESGAALTQDSIFGMMLQDLIAQGSPLRQEFDYRVDQELAARRQIPLLFVEMIDLLNDCQEKVCGREAAHRVSVPPLTFEAEPNPTACRSNSIESHPDNVYTMATRPLKFKNSTTQARNCFRCGSGSHLIGTCPVPESSSKSLTANNQTQNRLQTPQYQAYYPILAPPVPGYGFQQFYQPIVHTGNSPANPGRAADNYRPVYPQGFQPRPAAREASAEVPPDVPQMFVMQPAPPMFAMPQDPSAMFNMQPAPHMFAMPQDAPTANNIQPLAQMIEMDCDVGAAQPSFGNLLFTAASPAPYADSPAIFDTGATHHLTGDSKGNANFPGGKFNPYTD
ncbi:hypothetical protein PTTG_28014 [Puccinia triticina 1-1 BBBD Race 1]|uniref:CCHC-type domain-containing protein n=1 Tax=Puccinia triticina (isolate 1-1 / race 1 (BBBD)) TaxID=630390 RepID=A0A180GG06_PUCT1|nr:hypothetical protein PTTG_28014 [Puccinia triticina 1-1 BBBD Race 1]